MKRGEFMRHLRRYGCFIKREGSSHTIVQNIKNGILETIPRHTEIDNILVKKICKRLDIKTPFER
ncbi:MAG: type II toxin-antitoxin system HicA family toxin [Nitrospirae bacterium]|nr:type II toxin-antitoxin system HicA family toxin [Nitrospirota bacterium]